MPQNKEIVECKILKHFIQKEIDGEYELSQSYYIYSHQADLAGLHDMAQNLISMSHDEELHHELLKKMISDLDIICPE